MFAFHLPVFTREGGQTPDPQRGQVHDSVGRLGQGRAQGLLQKL